MADQGRKGKKGNDGTGEQADPNARHATSEADRAKARKWFDRARQLFDTRSYDYAIKCFIDGLALWPDAVQDAHQPLRACAMARHQTGGKKPGMMDSVKYSMSHKDPVKAMLNAEWLWAHDPANVNYMEGILKNAGKARCDDVVMWIGPIYREACETEKKPSPKRFALLKEVYEALGDRARARNEMKLAVEAYERAAEALSIQQRLAPRDLELGNVMRDLSGKLTILKGQYETAESFTESILDAADQREIHDKERMVQADDRLEKQIAAAEKDLQENPGVPAKVVALADALCKRDNEEDERKAITILMKHFQEDGDYRFKMRADDIRMRQLARRVRRARELGDRAAVRAAVIRQLQFEIPAFKERVAKYPTDMRIRYEYGVRLFQARHFDDAIPCFQTARSDPKNRVNCALHLGRCFFEKRFFSEAVETLEEGRSAHGIPDDTVAKELLYWLGRAQAEAGNAEAAKKTYGHLLQLDYNFKDVRVRIEGLRTS